MLMSGAHVARIRDVRNTAKIQKYKSTKRRGLTALTGVARDNMRNYFLREQGGRLSREEKEITYAAIVTKK